MLQVSREPRSERIACLNWPEAFPYRPEAAFEISHTGDTLHLSFRVKEDAVRAVCAADREHSYEDSCVEFFFEPHPGGPYYNLECTCTGKILLCIGAGRHGREFLPETAYAGIVRRPSLGTEPFGLLEQPTAWTVALDIPAATFGLDSFAGLQARGNFYKCGDGLPVPHYLSWAPIATAKPDFHRPEYFDTLVFI